jgi:zinc and cadmium transporter
MTLISIILATLAGGVLSVLLAATLALTVLARFADKMVAFAVGVLLTFALTDILPEAVHLGMDISQAGWWLLGGLTSFFLLEKLALWRHDHASAQGHTTHQPQVAMIVVGDALHNFVDGVLIAAAFLTDAKLGWVTALAVMAHEIPQEISDFMVLLDAGVARGRALALNALSGAAMTLGGVLGWLALDHAQAAIPVILVLAAASFIYIAIADLIPELHRRRTPRDSALQFILLLTGVGVALAAKLMNS